MARRVRRLSRIAAAAATLAGLGAASLAPRSTPGPVAFSARDLGPVFDHADPAVLGLDGAFSTPVSPGRSLWVFGDTLIGSLDASGDRVVRRMPSSTAAVVDDADWRSGFAHARFVGGAAPRALLAPTPPKERLWPLDWVRSGGRLWLYYVAITLTGHGALDFEVLGSGLARRAATRVPRFVPGPLLWTGGAPAFGASALAVGGWIYVYAPGPITRLARVRPARIAERDAYRYWAGRGRWTASWRSAAALPSAGPEASVRFDSYLGRFVMADLGLAKVVRLRFASHPWGPWSRPTPVCSCQPEGDPEALCYGAKQHAELDRDGGRTVFLTYNTNTEPALLDRRPDLYWPHLVRIRFTSPARR